MKSKKTKDLRPALAFDQKIETQIIQDALNTYRIHHTDPVATPELEETLRSLCDELEKCEKMFNKKG
tara:strand:+ start:267 stop:467 length:201 start_codon:yes stop_codon:yes gene_type:complete